MKRVAAVIGLPQENAARYEELHTSVWPAVLARLSASHVVNYSIYRYGELLFSHWEYDGDNLEVDMEAISVDPVTREWSALCMPLQQALDDRADGEWWKELPEVFHLD